MAVDFVVDSTCFITRLADGEFGVHHLSRVHYDILRVSPTILLATQTGKQT